LNVHIQSDFGELLNPLLKWNCVADAILMLQVGQQELKSVQPPTFSTQCDFK